MELNARQKPETTAFHVKIVNVYEMLQCLRFRAIWYQSAFGYHGRDVFDKHAVHVVALQGHCLVAGARLLGPTPLPLELPVAMSSLSLPAHKARVMQAGALWIDPVYRRASSASAALYRSLFGKMLEVARRFEVTGLVLRTSESRMTKWYRAVGFYEVPDLNYLDPHWGLVFTMYMPISRDLRAARAQ